MRDSQVVILIEALEKKKDILASILEKSQKQLALVKEEFFQTEAFDQLVEEKDQLLKSMEKVDDGFDATFERIREDLLNNQDLYKAEIKQMQELIKQTLDLGSEIHQTEEKAKNGLSTAILRSKRTLSTQKSQSQAVYDYYKQSSQGAYVESYFLDQKK